MLMNCLSVNYKIQSFEKAYKMRKFKIELQFSVSDMDLNNLYLKTPRG